MDDPSALDLSQNRLLASLSPAERDRLRPHLEPVVLEYKRSLYGRNEQIQSVYFITSGVGSLVNTMQNGQAAEVGTIGNEGFVGLPIVLGDEQAPTSVYMQVPGEGLMMKASSFREEILQNKIPAGRNAPLCPCLLIRSRNRPPAPIFILWNSGVADGC
jgi:CRP-like cAMP-binding protein